jgi:hypothetical protein
MIHWQDKVFTIVLALCQTVARSEPLMQEITRYEANMHLHLIRIFPEKDELHFKEEKVYWLVSQRLRYKKSII